jgi:hypothetical protein
MVMKKMIWEWEDATIDRQCAVVMTQGSEKRPLVEDAGWNLNWMAD